MGEPTHGHDEGTERDADRTRQSRSEPAPNWLDVGAVAHVHASSEDPRHPVAHAFSREASPGWRAAHPGAQEIDVHFRQPRDLTRIRLVFADDSEERTQQFTVWWSARRGERQGEVVRQQFNFSPAGATREVETYVVALEAVEMLRIRITPDISGRSVRASLVECRLA
jgi:hypothetical protein